MPKINLRVTYKISAHNISEFERIFLNEIFPLADKLGIPLSGFYRTLIGNTGEFMEIWNFESLGDFERKWPTLMNHPELINIFKITGPMVEDENFTILEKIAFPDRN